MRKEVNTADHAEDDQIECWCGARGSYEELFSDSCLDERCGGSGMLYCECGGDSLCICHHHGEVPCSGCVDCLCDVDDALSYGFEEDEW